jgi:hypothetical protein
MMPVFSIGIVPGHSYTFIYFSRDYVVLEYSYFLNCKFLTIIVEEIERIIKNIDNLSYLTILNGPAPLMTTRAICAWAKGWSLAKEIPIICFGGSEYYQREDLIFMNLFGGRYLLNFKKENVEKRISYNEIDLICFDNINTIEITKGVILPENLYFNKIVTTVFMPNFNKIAKCSYEKFCYKNISDIYELKPY